MLRRLGAVAFVALQVLAPAFSARADDHVADVGPGPEPVPTGFAATLHVPADFTTIQEAVDHAKPGGMVLIAAGVYHEAVVVATPYITIRGEARNDTVLDGRDRMPTGIHVVEADGVTVENLTARHFASDGVQWSSVFGYRASYVTAYDNGDHGISAIDSRYGQFDHSYAGGSADSGFAIGQCDPCAARVTDSLAEHNAVGFSVTNTGGDLAIVNNEARGNAAGIVASTLDSQAGAPQHGILIAGNYVHDNGSTTAPADEDSYSQFGIGVLIAGGDDDLVTQNLVEDEPGYGIAILPKLDGRLWTTGHNEVRDNIVRRSGAADLALGAPSIGGDCFAGNDASTSIPPAIQTTYGCDGPSLRLVGGGDIAPTLSAAIRWLDALDGVFPRGSWRRQPSPAPQADTPSAGQAPPDPAIPGRGGIPHSYRIREATSIGSAPGPRMRHELAVFGIPLAASWWSLVLGLYAYLLPFVLYAAWVSIALWDLIRQEFEAIPHRARWMAVVLLVPFLGPVIYFAFGNSPIPRQLRLMLVVGGMLTYAVIAALGAIFGG